MPALDLEDIELPDNHPFAVRQRLSPEEEALQASRLSARRGSLSADDAELNRQAQRRAAQMDAEDERRR